METNFWISGPKVTMPTSCYNKYGKTLWLKMSYGSINEITAFSGVRSATWDLKRNIGFQEKLINKKEKMQYVKDTLKTKKKNQSVVLQNTR